MVRLPYESEPLMGGPPAGKPNWPLLPGKPAWLALLKLKFPLMMNSMPTWGLYNAELTAADPST